MKLFKYILGRIGRSLISLVLIMLTVFLMMRALPVDRYYGDRADHLTDQEKHAILESYGLTDPIPVQFIKYVDGLIHGDLGTSITYYKGKSVTEIIAPKIGYSLRFGISSLILSLVLGIGLGLLMVRNKDRLQDHLGNGFILFVNAVPSAVYYLFLQFIGTKLMNIGMLYKEGNIATCILPVISMSLGSIASYAMWTRRYMLDQVNQDYVALARPRASPTARLCPDMCCVMLSLPWRRISRPPLSSQYPDRFILNHYIPSPEWEVFW